jgi:hypothetical protein
LNLARERAHKWGALCIRGGLFFGPSAAAAAAGPSADIIIKHRRQTHPLFFGHRRGRALCVLLGRSATTMLVSPARDHQWAVRVCVRRGSGRRDLLLFLVSPFSLFGLMLHNHFMAHCVLDIGNRTVEGRRPPARGPARVQPLQLSGSRRVECAALIFSFHALANLTL